jgi:signal transduction histidine kinase
MFNTDQEIINTILLGSLLFVFLAFIIVLSVIQYQSRQKKFRKEQVDLQNTFNQTLLQSRLEIQEQTFNYISQEIHDNVGQILSLAKVQINIMNESENINKELLDQVKENVGKAMSDLRDIAKSLSSERIKTVGIYETVANEADRINKSGVIEVVISMQGNEQKMNDQKKLILFRIIQESLQNSIKHADAAKIDILFNYLPGTLHVSIKDDGKGFDMNDISKKNSGLGLSNIKTRALLTGGTSFITSELNKGTIININIPYE